MFEPADSITFRFDERPRLRLEMPQQLFPIAAWLTTDVQGNLGHVRNFVSGLAGAKAAGVSVVGNGWVVRPQAGGVELLPRYNRCAPAFVPDTLLWPVLNGLAGFLADVGQRLHTHHGRPAHDVLRAADQLPDGSMRDHTYFPRNLHPATVAEAAQRAWQDPQVLRDSATGAWSGFWQGLEIGGYYEPRTGKVQVYFPVASPLSVPARDPSLTG